MIELRKKRRRGAEHITHEVRLAPSTVQSILNRPGELVHVDVKKLAGIPDGGGWRIHSS